MPALGKSHEHEQPRTRGSRWRTNPGPASAVQAWGEAAQRESCKASRLRCRHKAGGAQKH
eukprot:5884392-Alexandrium_andersonii.AAC.1